MELTFSRGRLTQTSRESEYVGRRKSFEKEETGDERG